MEIPTKRGDTIFGAIQNFESLKPDPDIIRLTEKIIDQNQKILVMNERLLKYMAATSMWVSESETDGRAAE